MRYAVLVAMVACSKSEPQFVEHELFLDDFPHCPPSRGNGFAHPFVIKVAEPDRNHQSKDVFFNAPTKPHHFTVDKVKHQVEVSFGECAEPFDPMAKRYSCEAATISWYATVPLDIDPAQRNSVHFAMPTHPVACLHGAAQLRALPK